MADAIAELKPIQEISPVLVKPTLPLTNTFTQVGFNKLGIQPGKNRQALQAIAENKPVAETAEIAEIAKGREDEYLIRFNPKNRDALQARYEDVRTEKQNVIAEMKAFAKERGIDLDDIPQELKGLVFGEAIKGKIQESAVKIVESFFKNRERGSFNETKYRSVLEQTTQYINLLQSAQAEGSLSNNLSAEQAYRLVVENIAAVAWQDRAAIENLLGDHGVRHLIDHNIKVSMQIADQLQAQGVQIAAMDRLILHQTMMYHDLGYAMGPVRDAINTEGIKGQDAGHNVLGAKFVREKTSDRNDLWNTIFTENQLDIIHSGILYHDKDALGGAGINFVLESGAQTPEAQRKNIESIIRVADNTHAFEDKLPELLYSAPQTLKYMRLLQSAGEIGESREVVDFLKRKLKEEIGLNKDISEDDKESLGKAVGQLEPESYKFSVGRICGNKPEYAFVNTADENGNQTTKLQVTVQESKIHQEVIGLYGQKAYEQLIKFIADNTGQKKEAINLDQRQEGSAIIFDIKKGSEASPEINDYQKKITELLLSEPAFVAYANADSNLRAKQKALENKVQQNQEDAENIGIIKKQRLELLKGFFTV